MKSFILRIIVFFVVLNSCVSDLCATNLFQLDSASNSIKYSQTQKKLSNSGFGGSAGLTYHFNREVDDVKLLKSFLGSYYSLYWNYRAIESDSSLYDMAYGLPTITAGVMFGYLSHIKMRGNRQDINYNSHLGNQFTAFLGLSRDFLRNDNWCVGFTIENGISLTTTHYNKHNNVDNRFIGSNFSIYFGGGIYAKYTINPNWEAMMELALVGPVHVGDLFGFLLRLVKTALPLYFRHGKFPPAQTNSHTSARCFVLPAEYRILIPGAILPPKKHFIGYKVTIVLELCGIHHLPVCFGTILNMPLA